MKIVIDEAIPYIEGRIRGADEIVYKKGSEISPADVSSADILIIRTRTRCNAALFENSRVRLIATATIGTDHIDLDLCEKKGINVISAPGCNAPGVAQYVLASLFRSGFNPGKDTLGIIGCGNVGSIVREWCHKMGIKTLVNDPPKAITVEKEDDASFTDLDSLLEKSDAITLHVPYTENGLFPTRQLIDADKLAKMKDGAILVNSSRGGVVDEKSLLSEISSRGIKAIIDVWENEPDIDIRLLDKAVISTPHIAGYSVEGKMRGTRMVLEALRDIPGLEVDTQGLECQPREDLEITKGLIENSYNPLEDSRLLKKNPREFEKFREHYTYRHEPLNILPV